MKLSNHIEITGVISSAQGNKKGCRNWLNHLHEATKTSEFITNYQTAKVQVHFTSEDNKVNELLSKVVGAVQVSEIKFPWDDVPEQPKCNGDFNRVLGEIEHTYESCDVHTVLTHTHKETD